MLRCSITRPEIYIQFRFQISVIQNSYITFLADDHRQDYEVRVIFLEEKFCAFLQAVAKRAGQKKARAICAGINPSLGGRRRHKVPATSGFLDSIKPDAINSLLLGC
jgi:hypothetical protein